MLMHITNYFITRYRTITDISTLPTWKIFRNNNETGQQHTKALISTTTPYYTPAHHCKYSYTCKRPAQKRFKENDNVFIGVCKMVWLKSPIPLFSFIKINQHPQHAPHPTTPTRNSIQVNLTPHPTLPIKPFSYQSYRSEQGSEDSKSAHKDLRFHLLPVNRLMNWLVD